MNSTSAERACATPRLPRPRELRATIPPGKRALDLIAIGVGLPLVLPLMLLIAAFIKLVSPGPVFFRQERVGFRECLFQMFKFRSMHFNADPTVHESYTALLYRSDLPLTKIDKRGDSRLIPFGRLLRASGLDELPQLINVLRGEMSLVGPRPCTLYEYGVLAPEDKARFETLPGLTGLWQVSGKNKTTYREMIALDIDYARRRSVGLDLRIMARTLPVLAAQVKEMLTTRKPRCTQ